MMDDGPWMTWQLVGVDLAEVLQRDNIGSHVLVHRVVVFRVHLPPEVAQELHVRGVELAPQGVLFGVEGALRLKGRRGTDEE